MNQAPRYDMNFQRYYSNLMDFLLNRRSPLLPRVNETQSQVQVLVQEPDLGRKKVKYPDKYAKMESMFLQRHEDHLEETLQLCFD